jgi:uncharacterized membrane protein YcjF (UPF0283 family)
VEIVVGLLLTRMVLLRGLVEPEVQQHVMTWLYMAAALLIVLNLVRSIKVRSQRGLMRCKEKDKERNLSTAIYSKATLLSKRSSFFS